MRVFIETTIVSYLTARPSRDVLQVARQQVTREWWETRSHLHELYTSQVVLDEAAKGDPVQAANRLALLRPLSLLGSLEIAESLSCRVIEAGILPSSAAADVACIALSTVHRMDVLLSWNFRHLTNATIQAPLRRLMKAAGFELPVICTPEELLEDVI